MKTKRICAGRYEISHGEFVATISHNWLGGGGYPNRMAWIANANWDRHLYTDPVETKAQAVRAATQMINDAINAELQRLVASNTARLAALQV